MAIFLLIVGSLPDVGQLESFSKKDCRPTRYEVFGQPRLCLIALPRKICDATGYKGNYEILGRLKFEASVRIMALQSL
jgi:hypothetical protein